MAISGVGKNVRFALGTKESLMKSDRIVEKVEVYLDRQSGMLIIVPIGAEDNMFLKGEEWYEVFR